MEFNVRDLKNDEKSPSIIKILRNRTDSDVPIFELPNENYSGLSNVKQIQKSRNIIIDYLIKKAMDEISGRHYQLINT